MTETASVWQRTAEADTWSCVNDGLPCSVTLLSPQSARRESPTLDPEVTHTVRAILTSDVRTGHRLRLADGTELLVKAVRSRPIPPPGQTVLGCASVKAVL